MNQAEALRDAMQQPGAVWCYSQTAQGVCTLDHHEPAADRPFRWLHLNLADQRSLHWLDSHADVPPALLALMRAKDGPPRLDIAGEAMVLTLHDFERDFATHLSNRIGVLHVLMRPGLLVTGRVRPLRGADLVRERLKHGPPITDAAQALEMLLDTHVEGLSGLIADVAADLLDAETELMADERLPDTRELMGARRLSAQLHRMTGGLRTTILRMERESRSCSAMARDLLPRIATLDGDIVAAQHQLRQLRDELDLQAAQRTNQNVYLLSVMTALMMPATLVTGFFGMNTGGLPFAQGEYGTVLASLVALLSGALTYWLLRIMGLVRRN